MNNEERRALYTALRLNWLQDPTLPVKDWQVEDYREMPYSILFERLRNCDIDLDRLGMLALINESDNPEDLCEMLVADMNIEPIVQDQIYLVLFELWRRLATEKPCLSIFCDELDYQIYLYDQGEVDNIEALQDVLGSLQVILEENSDRGVEPDVAFGYVSNLCAHDVEGFLLDYMAEQIDEANFTYATELLEIFTPYISSSQWLDFLRARLLVQSDSRAAQRIFKRLLEEEEGVEFDFYLEMLSFLAVDGEEHLFKQALDRCIALVHAEEDLQDLLMLCQDYQQAQSNITAMKTLQRLSQERSKRSSSAVIKAHDPALVLLRQVMA
jgi:hypothetical protein